MQKYDTAIIDEILHFFAESERAAKTLIDKEDRLDDTDIAKLIRLYQMRRAKLDLLDQWYKSESGENYIKNFPNEWKSKIQLIIQKDSEIIKIFEKRVKDLGDDIRKLLKRKSILIYSKGEPNENRIIK